MAIEPMTQGVLVATQDGESGGGLPVAASTAVGATSAATKPTTNETDRMMLMRAG